MILVHGPCPLADGSAGSRHLGGAEGRGNGEGQWGGAVGRGRREGQRGGAVGMCAKCTHYTSNPNLFDSCWLEFLVVNVRLDLLYDSVRNVVLVVVKEALEELARVLQHGLARLPVVIDLGRRRVGGGRGKGGEGRGAD